MGIRQADGDDQRASANIIQLCLVQCLRSKIKQFIALYRI